MHWDWLAEVHRPSICENDIAVVDFLCSCFLYNLIGEKDPIPNVIVDRVAECILGLDTVKTYSGLRSRNGTHVLFWKVDI